MSDEPKAGDTWVMRNGDKVTIDKIVTEDTMPVKSKKLCWQINGRYWDDDFEHRMDLIFKL